MGGVSTKLGAATRFVDAWGSIGTDAANGGGSSMETASAMTSATWLANGVGESSRWNCGRFDDSTGLAISNTTTRPLPPVFAASKFSLGLGLLLCELPPANGCTLRTRLGLALKSRGVRATRLLGNFSFDVIEVGAGESRTGVASVWESAMIGSWMRGVFVGLDFVGVCWVGGGWRATETLFGRKASHAEEAAKQAATAQPIHRPATGRAEGSR